MPGPLCFLCAAYHCFLPRLVPHNTSLASYIKATLYQEVYVKQAAQYIRGPLWEKASCLQHYSDIFHSRDGFHYSYHHKGFRCSLNGNVPRFIAQYHSFPDYVISSHGFTSDPMFLNLCNFGTLLLILGDQACHLESESLHPKRYVCCALHFGIPALKVQ